MKRVEILKPDGGVRKLGIPTVLDRFIPQAVMRVLQRRWRLSRSQAMSIAPPNAYLASVGVPSLAEGR